MKKLILSVALLIAVPSVYSEEKLSSAFGIEFGKAYTDEELRKIGAVCRESDEYIYCELSNMPKPYSEFHHYVIKLDLTTRRPYKILATNLPDGGGLVGPDTRIKEGEASCEESIKKIKTIIELNRGLNLRSKYFPDNPAWRFDWDNGLDDSVGYREISALCSKLTERIWMLDLQYTNYSGVSKYDTSGL